MTKINFLSSQKYACDLQDSRRKMVVYRDVEKGKTAFCLDIKENLSPYEFTVLRDTMDAALADYRLSTIERKPLLSGHLRPRIVEYNADIPSGLIELKMVACIDAHGIRENDTLDLCLEGKSLCSLTPSDMTLMARFILECRNKYEAEFAKRTHSRIATAK